ncbi:hypothetical protein SpCBS45565_g00360 [Spizellomyces sp. 'palustris']|nr:hypothetical protein SpCBS45565_g00360 [Spizellomyces sp. 'palustris']
MTSQLPPNLLKLFAPRPPLPHLQPLDRSPAQRRGPVISGVAAYLERCKEHDKDYVPTETRAEIKKRLQQEREQKAKEAIQKGLEVWDPSKDDHIVSDPYKTLFVARLSYETTEKELKREFETFGPIKTLRIVQDETDKSRGYAFIEYEREKDMKAAYKEGDGMKIDDRRVLVDVERGRTVKGWRPRRLGGGLGGTRIGGPDVNQRHSGREGGSYATGGYQGGYGGDFGGHGGYRGSRGGGGYGDRRGGFGYGGGGMDRRRFGGPGGPPGGGGGGYGDRPDRGDRDRGRYDRERDHGDHHGSRGGDRDGDRRSSRGDHDDRRGSRSDRDKDRRRSKSPRRERERSHERTER